MVGWRQAQALKGESQTVEEGEEGGRKEGEREGRGGDGGKQKGEEEVEG